MEEQAYTPNGTLTGTRTISGGLSTAVDRSVIQTRLDKILGKIFAYGVDWTEYKDKSEYDHNTSMFAAKIKAQQKEALKQELLALLHQYGASERKSELELIELAQQDYDKWSGFCMDDTSDFGNYIMQRKAKLTQSDSREGGEDERTR